MDTISQKSLFSISSARVDVSCSVHRRARPGPGGTRSPRLSGPTPISRPSRKSLLRSRAAASASTAAACHRSAAARLLGTALQLRRPIARAPARCPRWARPCSVSFPLPSPPNPTPSHEELNMSSFLLRYQRATAAALPPRPCESVRLFS